MGVGRVFSLEFIDFMVGCGALLFGDFTLKSGRRSPYFINTGEYKTGAQLLRLGDFYAKLVHNSVRSAGDAGSVDEVLVGSALSSVNESVSSRFSVLFGPAYKGIPLVTATAARLASDGLSLCVSFNRKERKDHGEGDLIMGYRPRVGDRVAIIEDVTAAGTSVRETLALFAELGIGAEVVALYISVDRMERGSGALSAIDEFRREFGIEVFSIASVVDVIEFLECPPVGRAPVPGAAVHAANMREYLRVYGGVG